MNFDIPALWALSAPALVQTLYMVGVSSAFATLFGIVMGITLYLTESGSLTPNRFVSSLLGAVVNLGRSLPFVILIIAIFPLAKLIVGTTIGPKAAIVPLTVAASPFVARIIESALKELDRGVIEAAQAMGASTPQIIFRVLLPECAPGIVLGITTAIINLIGYSAMAGTIGGGGLGDLAVRYGFIKFRMDILVFSVILMVALVTVVQVIGHLVASKLDKRRIP